MVASDRDGIASRGRSLRATSMVIIPENKGSLIGGVGYSSNHRRRVKSIGGSAERSRTRHPRFSKYFRAAMPPRSNVNTYIYIYILLTSLTILSLGQTRKELIIPHFVAHHQEWLGDLGN